jgi:hypothetical protein
MEKMDSEANASGPFFMQQKIIHHFSTCGVESPGNPLYALHHNAEI